MKRYFNTFFLAVLIVNTSFSQMSFNRNMLKESTFDLKTDKTLIFNTHFSALKILTTHDENDLMTGRRRSNRGNSGSSDGGVYVNIGLGYGLGMGSQNISGFTDHTVDSSSINTESQIDVSLGKGLCLKLGFGYMINANLGFELGASYLMGSKTTSTNVLPFGLGKKQTISSDYYASMFVINPSIVIASGMEGFNPYAKFGMILGFASFYNEKTSSADTFAVSTKTKYDGGMAIGFNASLGCSFSVSDNISIFAELILVNMSYAPDKSEITEYTSQGIDKLSSLKVKQKQINYYDTLLSTPIPDTEPNQALKQSYAFGSIGINIGMKIMF